MPLHSINPTTDEIIHEYPEMSSSELDTLIEKNHQAFLSWRAIDFATRGKYLANAAEILRSQTQPLATLIATEMGKPLKQGMAEIEKCALACDYYVENAEKFLHPEIIHSDAQKSFVTYQPLGTILGIMPWNFPFWQVFRFAAPTLMAGNTAILKHASNVSGCAIAIEKVFRQAGFPENVFCVALVSSTHINRMIENPRIAAVTLTGSTLAGKSVAAKTGEMLKKTVLELGGSDPYVILGDADLNHTVSVCATARLNNTGQSCIAAKRFIVVESLRKEFESLFVEKMKAVVVGDPLQATSTAGPLARKDLRDTLHQQVQKSIAQGARCLLGGEIPKGKGAFYPPTVLTNVKKGMPAYDEELFGPVAAIIEAKNEAEAIAIANDSPYGLGAAVFTCDLTQGEKIAALQLQAGNCFVNAQVRSDPRLPFGGIKESGYGRELSHFGIKEFVNIKTVYIK